MSKERISKVNAFKMIVEATWNYHPVYPAQPLTSLIITPLVQKRLDEYRQYPESTGRK